MLSSRYAFGSGGTTPVVEVRSLSQMGICSSRHFDLEREHRLASSDFCRKSSRRDLASWEEGITKKMCPMSANSEGFFPTFVDTSHITQKKWQQTANPMLAQCGGPPTTKYVTRRQEILHEQDQPGVGHRSGGEKNQYSSMSSTNRYIDAPLLTSVSLSSAKTCHLPV